MRMIQGGFYQATADEFDDIVSLNDPMSGPIEIIPIQWVVPMRRLYTRQEIVNTYREGRHHSPILVNGCGEILDGHKRFAAMQRLQLQGIAVVIDYTAPIPEQGV